MNVIRRFQSLLCKFIYTALIPQIWIHESCLFSIKASGGAGVKLFFTNAHARNLRIVNKGINNTIEVKGGGLYHSAEISIEGNDNSIEIKNGCALADLNVVIRGNGCKVVIGENTTSNGTSIYCIGNKHQVIIGKDCMFAKGTELWSSDSHTIIDKNSRKPLNTAKHSVFIGNHVWIAERAKVLKGVHVADNCVLGMECILTKDTEPYCLYVGLPGRKVKENISWERNLIEV